MSSYMMTEILSHNFTIHFAPHFVLNRVKLITKLLKATLIVMKMNCLKRKVYHMIASQWHWTFIVCFYYKKNRKNKHKHSNLTTKILNCKQSKRDLVWNNGSSSTVYCFYSLTLYMKLQKLFEKWLKP